MLGRASGSVGGNIPVLRQSPTAPSVVGKCWGRVTDPGVSISGGRESPRRDSSTKWAPSRPWCSPAKYWNLLNLSLVPRHHLSIPWWPSSHYAIPQAQPSLLMSTAGHCCPAHGFLPVPGVLCEPFKHRSRRRKAGRGALSWLLSFISILLLLPGVRPECFIHQGPHCLPFPAVSPWLAGHSVVPLSYHKSLGLVHTPEVKGQVSMVWGHPHITV